ncbi:TPA: hypothetical protein DIU22_03890 [Candidatus Woesebacteria bacterium]|nr:hypothetical protein [Candidatus Woesebacteria bacterium]
MNFWVDNIMNLDGEWAVTCHGWASIFNPLGDHKIIKDGEGFNRAVGIEGAHFYVSTNGEKYCLDYNHPKNHEFFCDIIDVVEEQDDGTFRGILYKGGIERFEFTLTRVK